MDQPLLIVVLVDIHALPEGYARGIGIEHDRWFHLLQAHAQLVEERLAVDFGPDVLHPSGEIRTQAGLMLEDKNSTGPEHLYTIYMDILRQEDQAALQR